VIATMMTVTLSCDHRVVDGALGAEFLATLKGIIEEPLSLML
jgi:pyruvate dehydrogenase E2 component (dihydrolipoamide acetyltransferase)